MFVCLKPMFVQFPLLLSGWGRQAFTQFAPILKNILNIHSFSLFPDQRFHKLYPPPLILPAACVLSKKWKFSFPVSEPAPFNRIRLAVWKYLETFSSCFQFQANRGKDETEVKRVWIFKSKQHNFLLKCKICSSGKVKSKHLKGYYLLA